MDKAKNEVVAGDYTGRKILCSRNKMILDRALQVPVEISLSTVDKYEVVDEENAKSLASAFGRGLVGGALFGPLGMVAGALCANNTSCYLVSIDFKNGDKSLLEMDKKTYKSLLKVLFGI